jgi:LytS/YehU family sensor histidine kinase
LYFSIKQWQQSARERERLLRTEADAREARLSALCYQLNPHFLFNALNAVSTLVLEGNAPSATRMIAQISELLRTTLDNEVLPEVALAQEVTFTQRYLAIEHIRLGDRLHVDWAIAPETLDALVPNMLLQPLVENAVRHGVAPTVEGGTVAIRSLFHDAHLKIIVKNSGRSRTVAPVHERKTGNRIGLANTAERLRTLYGADQKLTLEWPEAGGCEVIIEMPFRESNKGRETLACAH